MKLSSVHKLFSHTLPYQQHVNAVCKILRNTAYTSASFVSCSDEAFRNLCSIKHK